MSRGISYAARRLLIVIVVVLIQLLGLQPAIASPTINRAATTAAGSIFFPVGPVRVMDTRNGTGGTTGPVAAGSTVVLSLAGSNGVPSSGVTAVVLNLTVTAPTASGYVEAYPRTPGSPTSTAR